MSGYRCVNYYDLCRLCTTSCGSKIHIFSGEGRKKNLHQKISECVPIIVDEKDKLPKIVCGQCLQQIEAISEFRNLCVNSQTMLEGCLNSSTLQNGGKVYIKDGSVKNVTYKATEQTLSNTSQGNDFLSTIIQAVGIQSGDEMETRTQTFPHYTITTLDGKPIKTEQIEYKIEDSTAFSEKQAKHNSLAEFLKMKPNIKVTPIPKKKDPPQQQQLPSQIRISQTDIQKQKKTKYNLVLTSPQQQKTTVIPSSTTTTQGTRLQDVKILSPNKCFLPITIKDCNSDQQIVAQIDTKNLVLPTTYQLQMKLQPQIATVDGQSIVQLTPTAIPATISLAPSQTITQSYQQDHQISTNHILSSGIDASTSTNDSEIILTTNQIQNNHTPTSITIQQVTQPTVHTSMPKLQISTIPNSITTNSQIPGQKTGAITVHRINQQGVKLKPEAATVLQTQPHSKQTSQRTKVVVSQASGTTTTTTTTTTPKADGQTPSTECTICGRAFKKKEHLAQHMKLHAGLRPFKCSENGCNKAFSRKEHLMRHIVSHTGKKMFSCDLCQKLFSRKDNLNKHKRTHTNQSGNYDEFVCEVCNKSFVVKMYYIQHKLMHEKNGQITSSKGEKVEENNETANNQQNVQQQQQQQQLQQQPQQQQQTQVMQLQISSPIVTSSDASNSISISQASDQGQNNHQNTTTVLKTMGSHDNTVLNLPSSLASLVSISSPQFMTTSEIMGHIKIENN